MITETVYRCKDPQLGPHNRCAHPAVPPAGYKLCKGDPGCPMRLPENYRGSMCKAHEEEAAIRLSTAHHRYQQLMEE